MFEETSIPGTDDWWVMRLAEQLGNKRVRLGELHSFVDGSAVPFVQGTSASQREAYKKFVSEADLNVAELAVGARVARMRPIGFRTAAPGDRNGDTLAMATWSRSNMRVGARDLFWDVAEYGEGYTINTGPATPSADAKPLIVRASPWDTITHQIGATDWIADVGIHIGFDPVDEVDFITFWRGGRIRTAVRPAPKGKSSIPTDKDGNPVGKRWNPGRDWRWEDEGTSLEGGQSLGYTDQVPVVRYAMKDGRGVFENHLPTLRRINRKILEKMTITAMQAFRQRALTGDLPEYYPDDFPDESMRGKRIDYEGIFKAGPAALWMLPAGASIWESTITDITPLINDTKDEVRSFMAATSTPLYLYGSDAQSGSASGADLAREGIIFAVEDMIDRVSASIAQAQSLAFLALGDEVRAEPGQIETIWAAVARLGITEQASAASQAKAGGLSQRRINESIWQMSPAEIAQEEQDRSDEAFELALAAPAQTNQG